MRTVTANGTVGRRRCTRTRAAHVLLVLCALVTLFTAATAAPARAAADTAAQAAYLADRLRENPVHVTDQLPREIPRSTARAFAAAAARTGVPTYVLVLPSGSGDAGLLDAVRKRLGRDGLYVLVDGEAVADARAYGVRAPADEAVTASRYEVPHDAGALRRFERFAEVVALGERGAAARADAARAKYGDGDTEQPDLYIDSTDRSEQSAATGMLVVAVPLLILALVPYVRRWWLRLRRTTGAAGTGPREAAGAADDGPKGAARTVKSRPAKGKGKGNKGRKGAKGGGRNQVPAAGPALRWTVVGLALASVAAITVTAPVVYDQTRSSWSPRPRAAELNARLDRVAGGLAKDPVYADPESPSVLSSARERELHDRIRAFSRSEGGGPVFMALVPQLPDDESGGGEAVFAAALRDKLGRDGVYVVADPVDGRISAFNLGLRLDGYRLADLPAAVAEGDERALEAGDRLLGSRLGALMTLLDKADRTDEPTSAGAPYPAEDAVREDELAPLYGPDFWSALFPGVLLAGAVFGLVAGVLGTAGWFVRRRRTARPGV
ncbi:hypothetical protein SZN_01694 [Streptomyces zinciresistens K42]|uniref:TPM domain-containing protein n=1 Tax=Streptomyces zinciresistens K42 TaxID=700597 RepID=G2G4D7_9ACTN|nr:hypothetical protein [Streptomyces zinciresistens]EGX61612.1 hypothetical protein SZN_01694 [Streptomyces zinciresistens K42]